MSMIHSIPDYLLSSTEYGIWICIGDEYIEYNVWTWFKRTSSDFWSLSDSVLSFPLVLVELSLANMIANNNVINIRNEAFILSRQHSTHLCFKFSLGIWTTSTRYHWALETQFIKKQHIIKIYIIKKNIGYD